MYRKLSQLIASLSLVKKWLAFKLILWIGLILVISLILFFNFKNDSDRKMMINQMKEEAYRLSDIIKRGTRHDMLRARSDDLQETLEGIGEQEDVRKVRIIEQWRIKRSSYKEEIGMEVDKVDKKGGSCCDCHRIEGQKPSIESRYRFFMSEEGEPVLGFVNPIYNEKDCQSCHDPKKEILGVLDVILSMEKVHKKVRDNQKHSLIFILISFLLIAFSIAIFILRFVNKPIKQLSSGMRKITQGELYYHIFSPTEDEIGELAKSFNRMTVDLRTYQEQLIHAKEYIDNIIKSMTDTLIVMNPDGTIKMVNQATLKLLKYESEEELVGQPIEKIFAKETPFFKGSDSYIRIPKNLIKNYDTVYRTKQEIEIPINLSASTMRDKEGNILAIVCVARDMREIQKLIDDLRQAYKDLQDTQTQLIQSSRLASMGVLAADVAHEINNPITAIINYAGLLEDEVDPTSELANYAQWILKEGERITNIVKNLLSFARVDKQEHTFYMITDIINTSIALMEAFLAKDGIKIQTSYEPGLPRIKAKANQLEQVFINLIINAKDALNKKYPQPDENKMIKIDVKTIEKDGLAYIRILFSDNGIGIDEKHLDNIFDPSFTTKRIGNGTGLGLSISSWIVTDHNGKIEIRSQKGCQTTFIIDLPTEVSIIQTGQKMSVM
jgi:PAS domain S-box-containing protein